ncbi:VWA domain containing CoxE-like protein [Actinokineospora globicatena]|nr:VWA domain containing CoxE-like protein [Actinokineospora globicatena]
MVLSESDGAGGSAGGALDALVGHRAPYLIGVRHHSPALAAVVPALLEVAAPEVVLVELPEEMGEWLPHLAEPGLSAPVALSGAGRDGGGLAFYPFADFSPELAAIRWAAEAGVEVRTCDLPLSRHGEGYRARQAEATPLADALRRKVTGRDHDDLWDRLVEAAAPGQTPEAIRRAALYVGWALRTDGSVDPFDLRREAWMRQVIAETGGRACAAVIGSYHAAALLGGDPVEQEPASQREVITSLVPYTFAMLDERSGYPAGIRDPEWQQAVLAAAGDPGGVEAAAAAVIVRVCVRVRELGHPAGPGEAREALRLSVDLARLRGLPAPGRSEVVEAIQTVLTHADPLGRGRVVAKAAGDVLVGKRTGGLAPGTPRSGLAPSVEALLAELRLPGPDSRDTVELRLDPARSDRDARREITLNRLALLGVPYAESTSTAGVGGTDAITTRWTATWTPATAATLPVAGLWGATLPLAAAGRLRARRADRDGHTAGEVVADLADAARCGLDDLVSDILADAATVLPASASLTDLLAALDLLDRLRAGHLPGGNHLDDDLPRVLETAAVAQLDGLAGSESPADARSLVELGQRHDAHGTGLRLAAALRRLTEDGAPLIAGAATASRVLLGLLPPTDLGDRAASLVDNATTTSGRDTLRGFLTGCLAAAEPLLESPEALTPLLDRVAALADQDFLDRLPTLRAAFATVGPTPRQRITAVVEQHTGARIDTGHDPEVMARWVAAEQAALAVLAAHGLRHGQFSAPPQEDDREPAAHQGITPVTRWRLVLGSRDDVGGETRRYAAALDELYGMDRGEGADRHGVGGGRGTPFPNTRQWAEELGELFGARVREEVLAAAVEGGRVDAALQIDPDAVRPSVDLLRTVLALSGGLPEATVARLRPLVARLVRELTAQLAVRLRPALTGISLPVPSRRPGGGLDLRRTVRANLATARRGDDGRLIVLPDRPVFRGKARRTSDWRLVLVVDVSGSMEASTVWSALTAAVFAGVPALSTHFLAFSTEVIDLTDHVDDPLALLLEVSVGGGTDIAGALRHAKTLVTVPERTLVVVVSDFEEGGPIGPLLAQVKDLVATGVSVLGCASLDDTGAARYSTAVAAGLVAAGMPIAALSPLELATWVGDKVRA